MEFACKYCGRVFSSRPSLISHLKWCPNRCLRTSYSVKIFKFDVYWTPRRKIGRALADLARSGDDKAFLYVVKFLKSSEIIDDYMLNPINGQDEIEMQDETASPSAQAEP